MSKKIFINKITKEDIEKALKIYSDGKIYTLPGDYLKYQEMADYLNGIVSGRY